MTTIHVEVTQADIDGAERGSPMHCPIARALWRITGLTCSVGSLDIDAWREGGSEGLAWEARTPTVAANFIRAFDNKMPVSPFTFTLDIPAPATEGERK